MEREKDCQGRILVVDDEESVGRLLLQWLSDEGYQVEYAIDFDAVRRCMEQQPFDLVTLDIMMPGTDGLEVLGWLREHYPDTGAIMATAVGKLDTVIEAMRQGAFNYLLKPFNLDLVNEEISRAMERQRLVAENRAYQQDLERLVEERTRELRAAQVRLEQQVEELEARDRLVHFQMEAHTLEEGYDEIFAVLQQVFRSRWGVLYCPTGCAGRLAAVAHTGLSESANLTDLDEDSAAARAFASKKLEMDRDRDQVAVPVLYLEEILGVILVDWPVGEEEWEEALNALWRLAREIALVMECATLAETLAEGTLSSLDELMNLQ